VRTRSKTVDTAGVASSFALRSSADGRAARPGLKIGVCGRAGGDPASIDFFARAGLDYVRLLAVPGACCAASQQRTRLLALTPRRPSKLSA